MSTLTYAMTDTVAKATLEMDKTSQEVGTQYVAQVINKLTSMPDSRRVESQGGKVAAAYLAGEFGKLGLSKYGKDSNFIHTLIATPESLDPIPDSQPLEISPTIHPSHTPPASITTNSVIGVVEVQDRTKATYISAHYDHVTDRQGNNLKGALDNASAVQWF